MARELAQIQSELDTVYAPQRQAVQQRINELPSYYEAQRAGAETARQNAYADITRQANARGVVYSGAPIQEQQRYTGERYLPALAQLSGQEGEQRYGLQQALGQLNERQMSYAQQIREKELQLDEARRQFDAQMAAQREAEARAARAAAAQAAGIGGLLGGGGGGAQPQRAAATQAPAQTDAQRVVQLARQSLGGGNQSWGAVADYIEKKILGRKIETGSDIDRVLQSIYAAPQTRQATSTAGTVWQQGIGGITSGIPNMFKAWGSLFK